MTIDKKSKKRLEVLRKKLEKLQLQLVVRQTAGRRAR